MKGALAIIFCCVILVSGKKSDVHEPLSEENKDTLNAILDFMACVDEGKCNPVEKSPEVREPAESVDVEDYNDDTSTEHVTEPEKLPEPLAERSSYFNLCDKFHVKLEELESLHPELKSLKFELLEKLNLYASGFNSDCADGESLIVKILDLVIFVAEKLKVDFADRKHPMEIPVEKIIVEEPHDQEIGFVGSIRGIPGVHYPNYTKIPITSFSCSDKTKIPGFYADLETGCQVFHVCYEHRRESFLCPIGTIFNQAILACDYWYSSNCSLAPLYYDQNVENEIVTEEAKNEETIDTIVEKSEDELKELVQFLPVKAKIVEFPKEPESKAVVSSIDGVEEVATKIFGGIVSTSTKVTSKTRQAIKIFPKPKPVIHFPLKMAKLAKKATVAAVPLVKAKVVAAKVPLVKAKVVAAKVPLVKAKVVAAKVPLVKAKVVAAKVPLVKAKVVAAKVPLVKAKFITASAVPVAKAKIAKAAVPFYKVKAISAAASKPITKAKLVKTKLVAAPVVKVKKMAKVVPVAKMLAVKPKLAVPVMKAKLVKSAVISPLTKKALALGYLKLLKAKKLVMLG